MQISKEKKALYATFAKEYEEKYLLEKVGQTHLALYEAERQMMSIYWSDIKKKHKRGLDITDDVLDKLLPFDNTQNNRASNKRISIAPAITKDVKAWFEAAGWQKKSNWPKIAIFIYKLTYELIENNNFAEMVKFENDSVLSKGFRTGFLSPTFFFLNSKYRMINKKTILTLNFLYDKRVIDNKLSNYEKNLKIIDDSLNQLSLEIFSEPEKFDAFCHFMVDKRLGGYAAIEKSSETDPQEEEVPVDDENVPSSHWEAIYYIILIGNLLGYKTYVADPSREAFSNKLGEVATLKQIPSILQNIPNVNRIDAIWHSSKSESYFFEVEDGGTMRDALHRLFNCFHLNAKFFIVSPIENRPKFEQWMATEPYKSQ